jgi:hypothetical protein
MYVKAHETDHVGGQALASVGRWSFFVFFWNGNLILVTILDYTCDQLVDRPNPCTIIG